MRKHLKTSVLRAADKAGVSRLVLGSGWRRQRLLILCYHGLAQDDEHLWRSSLYMPPAVFARRLELIRESGCSVLPLAEAVRQLYAGTLPPRSVAITMDDGGYDFYRIGFPLLQEFGYPVTVYLTTYYSDFNRPVFDPALGYLLWKAAGPTLEWPRVLPAPVRLDAAGRHDVEVRVQKYCLREKLSGREKDALLAELAAAAGIDYEGLCSRRLITLMTPDEVRSVASAGADIQLHTHRHRVFPDRERTLRELDENRARIQALVGSRPTHFCYPSGTVLPEFLPWLRDWGMESATTCEPGFATRAADPLLLPRLVDVPSLSEIEFRGWLSGVAAALPRRRFVPSYWALKSE